MGIWLLECGPNKPPLLLSCLPNMACYMTYPGYATSKMNCVLHARVAYKVAGNEGSVDQSAVLKKIVLTFPKWCEWRNAYLPKERLRRNN